MSNATIAQEVSTKPTGTSASSEAFSPVDRVSLGDRLDGNKDLYARIDLLRQQARDELTLTESNIEQPRIFGFCAMLFVFGQIVSLWALANGHTAPMIIGLLFSFAGTTFGVVSYLNRKTNMVQPEAAMVSDQSLDRPSDLEPHRFSA